MENTTTFKHAVTFAGKLFDEASETHIEQDVTKEATFKSLNRTDPDQHLLHFFINSIIEFKPGTGGRPDDVYIGYEKMYDLGRMVVEKLLVINNEISEGDKTQILADSSALAGIADFFSSAHALPFFIRFKQSLVKSRTPTQL